MTGGCAKPALANAKTRVIESDLDELMAVTPSPWDKLFGASVFITGASGLFGFWVLSSLLKAVESLGISARATALVRNPEAWLQSAPACLKNPALTVVKGDLLTFSFPPGPFTHFIHLAAPSAAIQLSDPLATFDILAAGTRRVLDMALASGAPRFLYVSSGAVYGRGRPGAEKIAETSRWGPDPLAPGTAAYDEGKRAAELLCGIYHQTRGLPVVVSRCFSFVGPHLPLDAHFAAGNFARDALAGGPIKVSGDGTPVRSYLYLADLAWWLWTLLASGRPGEAYNTGSDEPVTVAELARLTGDCFLPPLKVIISEKPPPGAAPSGQVPSIDKARGELGLHPRVGLKEALVRTLSWAREEAP